MDSTRVNTSLGLNLIPLDQSPISNKKRRKMEENVSEKKEAASHEIMAEEMTRISYENKKLAEKLTSLCQNYNTLQSHVMDLMVTRKQNQINGSDHHNHDKSSKKRKADNPDNGYNNNNMINNNGLISPSGTNCSDEESCKRPKENNTNLKISRVYIRTDASDTSLIVKDGYQWKKYGQKVTRDNPSPRAYYKCSFAPSCPVKKKVQKSAENPCLLVATYEGEHNHMQLETRPEVTLIATPLSPPNQTSILSPTSPTLSFDNNRIISPNHVNTRPKEATDDDEDGPSFQQFLVHQMAASLSKDPNFTSALAAAISGRISDHSPEKY